MVRRGCVEEGVCTSRCGGCFEFRQQSKEQRRRERNLTLNKYPGTGQTDTWSGRTSQKYGSRTDIENRTTKDNKKITPHTA